LIEFFLKRRDCWWDGNDQLVEPAQDVVQVSSHLLDMESLDPGGQGKKDGVHFTSRVAFWFLIYSDLATITAFLMAGIWGAGNSIIPLAAGAARGTDFQETAIGVVAYSAAPSIDSVNTASWLRTFAPRTVGETVRA
jgi:hypothetical protein